jgi:two-component system CheB/CheR fusion protein
MNRDTLLELSCLSWIIIAVGLGLSDLFLKQTFLLPSLLGLAGFTIFLGVIVWSYKPVRTSDALLLTYERYRSMLDNLPVGVYRSTSSGKILEANRTFAEILGCESVEEVKKVNLTDIFVNKSDRNGQLEKLRDSTVFAEFELRRKDGQSVWVRDYPKATLNVAGNVDYMDGVIVQTHGIEAVVRAITEHRRLELMKDHFISAATHELRTPLVSIKGYADFILAEDPKSPLASVIPLVDIVRRNADRLLQLSDDLLDLQRMETGKVQLRIQEVDLKDLVKECVQEIQPLIAQKNQCLHMDLPSGRVIVHADPLRLSQALLNLLNNAIKFTAERGEITLGIEKESEGVKFYVRDTGIGINKVDLGRVFEPFAVIDKPSYFKGTGLGLSLTRKLVEAHGGQISGSSPGRGQGATFTIVLPNKSRLVEVVG